MSARFERTLPTGTACRADLEPGEELVITSPDGSQGGDMSFIGFDQALTRNINGWERYRRPWLVFAADPGMRLYDGDGQPVLEVVDYVGDGRNDIMYPGCWAEVYDDRRPGCRDLIAEALGIHRSELTGMLSFFVNAEADSEAYRGLGEVSLEPGDHIVFRALRPVAAAVSACPDVDIPGWRPGELRVEVRGGVSEDNQLERTRESRG